MANSVYLSLRTWDFAVLLTRKVVIGNFVKHRAQHRIVVWRRGALREDGWYCRKLPYYCPISEIPRAPLAHNTIEADSVDFSPTCLAMIGGVKASIDQAKAHTTLEASFLFVHWALDIKIEHDWRQMSPIRLSGERLVGVKGAKDCPTKLTNYSCGTLTPPDSWSINEISLCQWEGFIDPGYRPGVEGRSDD